MSDLYGGMGNNLNMNNNGMNDDKKKKMMIIGGAAVIGVIVIIMIVVAIISSINSQKNNIYVDGSLVSKMNSNIFYVGDDNVPYVSVERIAPLLSYQFFNGEYGTASEDRTFCYVSNEFEVAQLEMDSNDLYKTLVNDDSSTYDYYRMSYKVKRINDSLYISLPTMQKVFNVKYSYDTDKNSLTIQTLPALYEKYNTVAKNKGYYELSEDFSNQKALIQDMMVVVTKERMMGVISTKDNSSILGTKYNTLTYSEGMQEFIGQQNGQYGILYANSQNGSDVVKVGLEYSSLKLIDNKIGLYLVSDGSKYGVLDKNGRILINLEYDRIGIENPKLFPTDNLRNGYVLYDYCIPAKQGDEWVMFNINGEIKHTGIYGFGCVASSSQTSQNVLLIPASEGVEGIVIAEKDVINRVRYGIIDVNGMPRVPTTFDSIYKTISGGQTTYNMLFGNTVIPVKDRLTDNVSSGGSSGPVQIN